jgi:hypothetical protein
VDLRHPNAGTIHDQPGFKHYRKLNPGYDNNLQDRGGACQQAGRMDTINGNAMLELLAASGPDPQYATQLDLYGRFVGSWDIDNRRLDHETGQWQADTGHWHFGWILAGRGIQDTLEFAARPGTTVRLYDTRHDVWRVVWFAPSLGDICRLVGRHDDDGICQEGTQPDGTAIRWIFTDIKPNSFTWRGYIDRAGSGEWVLEQEMLARRSGTRD